MNFVIILFFGFQGHSANSFFFIIYLFYYSFHTLAGQHLLPTYIARIYTNLYNENYYVIMKNVVGKEWEIEFLKFFFLDEEMF